MERLFGTAKEYHNLRYTREVGKSKMKAKVGLTLACLNIKKLVKVMAGKPFYFSLKTILIKILAYFENSNAEDIKKTNIKTMFVFNLRVLFVGKESPAAFLCLTYVSSLLSSFC